MVDRLALRALVVVGDGAPPLSRPRSTEHQCRGRDRARQARAPRWGCHGVRVLQQHRRLRQLCSGHAPIGCGREVAGQGGVDPVGRECSVAKRVVTSEPGRGISMSLGEDMGWHRRSDRAVQPPGGHGDPVAIDVEQSATARGGDHTPAEGAYAHPRVVLHARSRHDCREGRRLRGAESAHQISRTKLQVVTERQRVRQLLGAVALVAVQTGQQTQRHRRVSLCGVRQRRGDPRGEMSSVDQQPSDVLVRQWWQLRGSPRRWRDLGSGDHPDHVAGPGQPLDGRSGQGVGSVQVVGAPQHGVRPSGAGGQIRHHHRERGDQLLVDRLVARHVLDLAQGPSLRDIERSEVRRPSPHQRCEIRSGRLGAAHRRPDRPRPAAREGIEHRRATRTGRSHDHHRFRRDGGHLQLVDQGVDECVVRGHRLTVPTIVPMMVDFGGFDRCRPIGLRRPRARCRPSPRSPRHWDGSGRRPAGPSSSSEGRGARLAPGPEPTRSDR